MPLLARPRWLVAALLALAGCASANPPSERLGATELPATFAQPGALTADALRQRLLSFADLAMSEMARGAAAAQAADSTPSARARLQVLQAEVAATSVALAVEPDPEAALQDLMVTIAAQRSGLASLDAAELEPAARAAMDGTLTSLESEVWGIGAGIYTPTELERLRARLKRHQEAEGLSSPAGLVRVADLPADAGPQMSKGLFAPINEANRQIEESRLLGERFLFLAERLPVIALWQAEAVTWELLASPESKRTLDGLSLMSTTLERLAARVDSLPKLMDDQRDAIFAAFDAREASARTLMSDAGELMTSAGTLVESGERLAGISGDVAANVSAAMAAAERTVALLRDADAPGGAMTFDVAAYESALRDFRSAAEALNSALDQAEGLATTPRALIDHAAWRGAQLILLFFVLLAAYRFGPALVARRSKA
jgi:hypothetical protein